jgi:hypothetical protein
MDKHKIEENIDKLIDAIGKQFVEIKKYPEKAPKFESDKLLGNIRALYEFYTVYNFVNNQPKIETPIAQASPPETQVIESILQEKTEDIIKLNIEEKQSVIVDNPTDIKETKKEEALPVKEIEEKKKEVLPFVEKNSFKKVDTFVTLNDANAEKGDNTLAGKLQKGKVIDLTKAVPLHEKFLYINELFQSDNQIYKDTLDLLNKINNPTEVNETLSQLSKNYKWDENSKAAKQFRQLIQRKFS